MSEAFAKRQGTIGDNILWLVKKYPDVIDDYRKLFVYYWYYINNLKMFVPQEILEKLDQPQSIGREFRNLVKKGYIVVDEKTKKIRLQNEENFRDYYRRKQ